MKNILIIGNGIAGVTAARHIRKFSNHKITIISSETDHFFSRTALMYIYMGHMTYEQTKPYEDKFWAKNDLNLIKGYVAEVFPEKKQVRLNSGATFDFDDLIIATGSETNFRGWPGENLKGVQGMVSKPDLDQMEENTKDVSQAVIVGGGLIGVELAEMLSTRGIEVTMIVREEFYWASVLPKPEAKLITGHIEKHGVNVLAKSELDKIEGDVENRIKQITLKSGKTLPCQWLGIATGVKPAIDFLKKSSIETDKGVLVNRKLQTNYENIYAIGDCAQQREALENRPPVEAVWYTGRIMGEALAQTLCGNPWEYNPGNWFNSAKFFDIEYQTYGWVLPNPEAFISDFYWQHPKQEQALHFQWNNETGNLVGINSFGIRLRHEVIDSWLSEGLAIDHVIHNLKKADFQKEFSKRFYKKIRKAFEKENSSTATARS
jgi:NAD(P)H-nitrite reductase large subunit